MDKRQTSTAYGTKFAPLEDTVDTVKDSFRKKYDCEKYEPVAYYNRQGISIVLMKKKNPEKNETKIYFTYVNAPGGTSFSDILKNDIDHFSLEDFLNKK